jgi:hypothetical protein
MDLTKRLKTERIVLVDENSDMSESISNFLKNANNRQLCFIYGALDADFEFTFECALIPVGSNESKDPAWTKDFIYGIAKGLEIDAETLKLGDNDKPEILCLNLASAIMLKFDIEPINLWNKFINWLTK